MLHIIGSNLFLVEVFQIWKENQNAKGTATCIIRNVSPSPAPVAVLWSMYMYVSTDSIYVAHNLEYVHIFHARTVDSQTTEAYRTYNVYILSRVRGSVTNNGFWIRSLDPLALLLQLLLITITTAHNRWLSKTLFYNSRRTYERPPLSRVRVMVYFIRCHGMCLLNRCLAMDYSASSRHVNVCQFRNNQKVMSDTRPANRVSELLTSNGRSFWLHYSGCQPSCHNVYDLLQNSGGSLVIAIKHKKVNCPCAELIKQHATKIYGGVEVLLHPFLTYELIETESYRMFL
jgi:hypothetical protein